VFGVYVRVAPVPLSVPLVGCVATAYVRFDPSRSLPLSVMALAVFIGVLTLWATATGASFTDWIVTETVVVIAPPTPSETWIAKLSTPL
jgi:hypothetical protein